MLVEQFERDITQGADGGIPLLKISNCFFALVAARIVSAGGMIVLSHGVADDELDACGNGNELKLKRTAIEQEGVAGFSQAGNELVHDADACANETVFGFTAELCNLRERELRLASAHQSERRGDFKSRRRT